MAKETGEEVNKSTAEGDAGVQPVGFALPVSDQMNAKEKLLEELERLKEDAVARLQFDLGSHYRDQADRLRLEINSEKFKLALACHKMKNVISAMGKIGEPFFHLSPQAVDILTLALQEAELMGHGVVNSGHLLCALLKEGDPHCLGALESMGVEPDVMVYMVSKDLREGTGRKTIHISLGPRCLVILDHAHELSVKMNSPAIIAGHILLGMLRERNGVARHSICISGIDMGGLCREICNRMGYMYHSSVLTDLPDTADRRLFLLHDKLEVIEGDYLSRTATLCDELSKKGYFEATQSINRLVSDLTADLKTLRQKICPSGSGTDAHTFSSLDNF